jgi:hypothetical protein
MPDTNKAPASQILRETAVQEETKLLGKNEFRESSSEYGIGSTPEEINGAKEERTKLTVINMFTDGSPYQNPDGENI